VIFRNFEELGAGEFGVVTRGMWKPSPNKQTEVAIKTLNVNASEKNKLRFLQEAAIMCQFDHENVIKLYGVVTDAPAMIVLEYMSRGDLREILIKLQPRLVFYYLYTNTQCVISNILLEMEVLLIHNYQLSC